MISKYFVFLPEVEGTVSEEFVQCLEKITDSRFPDNKPVKLNIFTEVNDYNEYLKVIEETGNLILNHFGDQYPAFNVSVHPPERPWKVVVEAGFMNTGSCELISKLYHSTPYIVKETDSVKEVWAGGLGAGLYHDDTRKASKAAFNLMKGILKAEHMSFDNIVRQWNFIGNILEVKNEIQNYQVFNEVRSEFYHKYRNIHSYPAATGIGMKLGGVSIDFCAVKAENNIKIIAIDNPDQIRPYDYSQQVLKGKPFRSKVINQPPQFERAVFFSDNQGSTLFVSGTASIIGQDTIGIDDVEKQTIVTIENISKLTDVKRIEHLSGDTDPEVWSLMLLRVYIRKQEEFAKVKAICTKLFPGVPAVYIEADVCRDNLLVEVEAEYSKK